MYKNADNWIFYVKPVAELVINNSCIIYKSYIIVTFKIHNFRFTIQLKRNTYISNQNILFIIKKHLIAIQFNRCIHMFYTINY